MEGTLTDDEIRESWSGAVAVARQLYGIAGIGELVEEDDPPKEEGDEVDETNQRYEKPKRGDTHLAELQKMTMPELLKTAADEDVQEIRGRENDKGVIEIPVPPLRVGEQVCVVEGPFEGMEGLFERYLTGAERVQILLKLLGALRHVELPRRSVMASA